MKNRVYLFASAFVIYVIIFVLFTRFEFDRYQIAEMIVFGTACGILTIVLDRLVRKLIAIVLKKTGVNS